jgi:diguanylate cyclase (GGDEF)-like protein
VLIVAAMKAEQFSRSCREQVEMIAAQLAIKIGLARAHDQINAMTLTDPLTGIANRRAFQRAMDSMHERAVRCHGVFSLILCDIDFFKSVNDNYGHPFGDCVIQQLAKQLAQIVRSGDLAARIGGEEFAILVEGSDGDASCDIAERLRTNVEQMKLYTQNKAVTVSISIGIASFPDVSRDKEQLIHCADQALYRAKKEGRNRVVRWQE